MVLTSPHSRLSHAGHPSGSVEGRCRPASLPHPPPPPLLRVWSVPGFEAEQFPPVLSRGPQSALWTTSVLTLSLGGEVWVSSHWGRSSIDSVSGKYQKAVGHPLHSRLSVEHVEEVQRLKSQTISRNISDSHFRTFPLKGKVTKYHISPFRSLILVTYLRFSRLTFPRGPSSGALGSGCTNLSGKPDFHFSRWGPRSCSGSAVELPCVRWREPHTGDTVTTWKRLRSIQLQAWACAMIRKDFGIVRIRRWS